jgi:alkanesulfonate monooxygenase SsuD/methylene tetrahydromethanopterin reductase-like flavin-dependent oxidoreductase (luciferase family)
VLKDWIPDGGSLDDLSYEQLVDEGFVFVGSPATVADRIRDFHADSGGFGMLLIVAGKDWGTFEQREKSMHLLIEQVAPALSDIGSDSSDTRVPANSGA